MTEQPRPDPSQPKRVRGGPSWVEEDKFTIEAKAPLDVTNAGLAGSPSRNLARLPEAMSQALGAMLEDRFQVKVHRATEQQAMYALTIAKSGLNKDRVTVPTPGDCLTIAEYSAAAATGRVSNNICGQMFSARGGRMEYSSVTLRYLAEDLSTMLEHVVLDRTGVETKFNIVLKPDSPDGTSRDASIAKGLEALGLRLEPTKGPAEYLVIESAQKPRPNSPAEIGNVPVRASGPRGAGR